MGSRHFPLLQRRISIQLEIQALHPDPRMKHCKSGNAWYVHDVACGVLKRGMHIATLIQNLTEDEKDAQVELQAECGLYERSPFLGLAPMLKGVPASSTDPHKLTGKDRCSSRRVSVLWAAWLDRRWLCELNSLQVQASSSRP